MPRSRGTPSATGTADTLVVDTVGIKPSGRARPGHEAQRQVHIIERIHLAPKDPDTLVDEMTIEDPEALEKPWVAFAHVQALARLAAARVRMRGERPQPGRCLAAKRVSRREERMMQNFCDWLAGTWLSQLFANAGWFVPTVQTIHILSIAAVIIMLSMIEFPAAAHHPQRAAAAEPCREAMSPGSGARWSSCWSAAFCSPSPSRPAS